MKHFTCILWNIQNITLYNHCEIQFTTLSWSKMTIRSWKMQLWKYIYTVRKDADILLSWCVVSTQLQLWTTLIPFHKELTFLYIFYLPFLSKGVNSLIPEGPAYLVKWSYSFRSKFFPLRWGQIMKWKAYIYRAGFCPIFPKENRAIIWTFSSA